MLTLKAGDKAFIDGFSGFIPCVVTRIFTDVNYPHIVHTEAIVTRTKKGYTKNELVQMDHLIIPRNAVRYRKYGTWIAPFERIIG